MLSSPARAAFLGLALLAAAPAHADDLANFNAAAEQVGNHNRVALGYLRTGNGDLASIELDRLRAAWTQMNNQFAGKWLSLFKDEAYTVKIRTDISTRLVTADLLLNSNRLADARQALLAVRRDFYDWRKSAGISVLADCIYDANAAMDALMVYNVTSLDWHTPDTASNVSAKAESYSKVLDRCDSLAGTGVRDNPEFRRLVDGARASMKFIPKAVAEHDTNLLHRVLIELRSFDNLMAFRFG